MYVGLEVTFAFYSNRSKYTYSKNSAAGEVDVLSRTTSGCDPLVKSSVQFGVFHSFPQYFQGTCNMNYQN